MMTEDLCPGSGFRAEREVNIRAILRGERSVERTKVLDWPGHPERGKLAHGTTFTTSRPLDLAILAEEVVDFGWRYVNGIRVDPDELGPAFVTLTACAGEDREVSAPLLKSVVDEACLHSGLENELDPEKIGRIVRRWCSSAFSRLLFSNYELPFYLPITMAEAEAIPLLERLH